MHELNRIVRSTLAVVDTRHVRHVGIVRLVQILAVPAGLEMHLCLKAVLASRVGHSRQLCFGSCVETGERDAIRNRAGVFVCQSRRIVRASESVTGEHTEAGRERFDVRSGVTTA